MYVLGETLVDVRCERSVRNGALGKFERVGCDCSSVVSEMKSYLTGKCCFGWSEIGIQFASQARCWLLVEWHDRIFVFFGPRLNK